MKNLFILKSGKMLALLLLPFLAEAQSGKYIIKVNVGHYTAPAKAYLFSTFPGDESIKDSTEIKNGKFEFKGNVSYPRQAMMVVNPAGNGTRIKDRENMYDFYVEPGLTTLVGNGKLKTAVFHGGPLTTDLNKFKSSIKTIEEAASKTYRERAMTPKDQQDIAFKKRIDKEIAQHDTLYKYAYLKFIGENPNSPISIVALRRYANLISESIDVERIEPLYKTLTNKVREHSELGKSYGNEIELVKKLGIGQMAPGFVQKDTAGKEVTLRAYLGKYVLIDFWASWCVPCRNQSPYLIKAFAKYKDKNFSIVSITLDDPSAKEAWLTAIRADKTGFWAQVGDFKVKRNPAAEAYRIFAIPQNYLIDPSGRIVAKNLMDQELEEKLAQLLK